MLYRCIQWCLLSWHRSRLGFVTLSIGEVSLGPLDNAHHLSIATNELFAEWCITERVKRLAGNEIELGMKISTIESRASNITMDKGNYVCCHNGSTDKDLHRICRSQYGHPSSAICYWPKRCLGHVYIVLEPVGSACLTFDDDRYYEFMWFDVPKFVRSPVWDREMTRSLEMVET